MSTIAKLRSSLEGGLRRYAEEHGMFPSVISISREAYRRLLEIVGWENRIGNLVIGCRPINRFDTPAGSVKIEIDETLDGMAVRVDR
jgi:hypothetical protein